MAQESSLPPCFPAGALVFESYVFTSVKSKFQFCLVSPKEILPEILGIDNTQFRKSDKLFFFLYCRVFFMEPIAVKKLTDVVIRWWSQIFGCFPCILSTIPTILLINISLLHFCVAFRLAAMSLEVGDSPLDLTLWQSPQEQEGARRWSYSI